MGTWSSEMTKMGWVARQLSTSNTGDPTFGTPSPFSYRRERKEVVVRNSDGVYYDSRDLLITHDEIRETDMVWLEGADKSDTSAGKVVANVDVTSDLDGLDTLFEVML